MAVLDGVREGVRAEGTRAKEELRQESSKSARSSADGEEEWNNRRRERENCERPRGIATAFNCC
jgi:hypothetical protein